jgi:serine/threonine protein phosphatase PrpC
MTLRLRYAARSDIGLIRSNNQDALYAGPRLVAVADGMGGAAAGDVASAVTIATFAALDDDEPPSDLIGVLGQTVAQANDQLRQMIDADHELAGMGTTLTAMLWSGGRLGLAHIGDSRAYLLRDGELTQITHDQTLVQRLVDEGELAAADVPSHPQRSVLLRVLNGEPDMEADLSVREAREGDRYLLCSDGLSSVVSLDTLRDTLDTADPVAAVDALVDLALRGGGPDNITCIVADVVGTDASASAEPVVGGSVADDGEGRRIDTHTAAGRAAALRAHLQPAARSRLDDPGQPRRRWHGPVLVLGLLIVVAGALFGGTWWYSQNQFYVGSDGTRVAVYKGISGDILGVRFSSEIERTAIQVSSLSTFERDKVEATISATSKHNAEQIVATLTSSSQSSTPPSTPPATSPTGSTAASSAASPAVSGSP